MIDKGIDPSQLVNDLFAFDPTKKLHLDNPKGELTYHWGAKSKNASTKAIINSSIHDRIKAIQKKRN